MKFFERFCFEALPALVFLLTPKKKRVKVFLIATETVVALAAPASKAGARALAFLKKRSIRKPFATGFANLEAARSHFCWTSKCEEQLKNFTPSTPLTLISKGVGFRLVSSTCPKLQEFLRKSPPLYLTSANVSGQPPLSFEEAEQRFSKYVAECYELCSPSQTPSTVIDVEKQRVLR